MATTDPITASWLSSQILVGSSAGYPADMGGPVTTDLQITRGERQLISTEVPLGPPNQTMHRMVAAVAGVPLGLGIVLPPHGLLLGIGGAVFVCYILGQTVSMMAGMKRFATDNNLAIGALGRGDLANAHEVFARWARSRHLVIAGTARHNLGWTLMLEGRVKEAATLLEDTADHYRRGLIRVALLPTTRLDTALCHALLGNLDVAETWCTKAEEPVKAPPQPTFPGMMALLRAVIDCRRGRAAGAKVTLEHAWNEHEPTLTGETLRMMRVLRAYACAAVDGPRSQGLVERVLGDMKPRYENEFGFLGATWPEMAAFLATHHLAG